MGEDFSYPPQDRYGLVMTSDLETRYYRSRALQPLLNELNVWDFSGTLSPCIWLTLSVLFEQQMVVTTHILHDSKLNSPSFYVLAFALFLCMGIIKRG